MWLVFWVRQQQCAYVTSLHLESSVIYCVHFIILLTPPFLGSQPVAPFPLACLCQPSQGCDPWRENADACWKRVLLKRTSTPGSNKHNSSRSPTSTYSCDSWSTTFMAILQRESTLRLPGEDYWVCAWSRHGCIELHSLSFSLINMQLPGGEQMAEPSLPPAGSCQKHHRRLRGHCWQTW